MRGRQAWPARYTRRTLTWQGGIGWLAGSWDEVFEVAVGLYLVGTVVWNVFATGEKVIE